MSTMPAGQLPRLIEEHQQAVTRSSRLHAFIGNPTFRTLETIDQEHLVEQYEIMVSYVDVLARRLRRQGYDTSQADRPASNARIEGSDAA